MNETTYVTFNVVRNIKEIRGVEVDTYEDFQMCNEFNIGVIEYYLESFKRRFLKHITKKQEW